LEKLKILTFAKPKSHHSALKKQRQNDRKLNTESEREQKDKLVYFTMTEK